MRLITLVVLLNLLYGCSAPTTSNINNLLISDEEIANFLADSSSIKMRFLKYLVNSKITLPKLEANIDKIYLNKINNSLVTYRELPDSKNLENTFSKVVIYQDELDNIKIDKYIDDLVVNSESLPLEMSELKEVINTETLIVQNLNNVLLKSKINVSKSLIVDSVNNSIFYINEQ